MLMNSEFYSNCIKTVDIAATNLAPILIHSQAGHCVCHGIVLMGSQAHKGSSELSGEVTLESVLT